MFPHANYQCLVWRQSLVRWSCFRDNESRRNNWRRDQSTSFGDAAKWLPHSPSRGSVGSSGASQKELSTSVNKLSVISINWTRIVLIARARQLCWPVFISFSLSSPQLLRGSHLHSVCVQIQGCVVCLSEAQPTMKNCPLWCCVADSCCEPQNTELHAQMNSIWM